MNVILNCSNTDCETRDRIDREANLKTCSGCKGAKYCSTKCQKVHWEKTHKHMCKNLRERRSAGFERNTSKLMKKAGKHITQEIMLKAYQEIKDGDNAVQALCWNQTLDETHVIEKKVSPPLWENSMAQFQPRLDNMMPCKRIVMTICPNRRGETSGTMYILCMCPSFGSKCPAPLHMRHMEC